MATKKELKEALKKKIKIEKKAYKNVLVITDDLKRKERKTATYTYISSIIFLLLYAFFIKLEILLLISVIFFGIATTILYRRNEDIRLGGVLTYPLLLSYSMNNVLISIHFFLVVLISLPMGIWLTRKGYIGQSLFYMLALFVFPLTVLSYYVFTIYFTPISLINLIFHKGTIIYVMLPHIYLYNLMKLPKNKIPLDLVTMGLLLLVGILIWLFILGSIPP